MLLCLVLWNDGLYDATGLSGVPDQTAERSDGLVNAETRITAIFVILGVLSWYGTRSVTDSRLFQFVSLLGVGIVLPTRINEWRR